MVPLADVERAKFLSSWVIEQGWQFALHSMALMGPGEPNGRGTAMRTGPTCQEANGTNQSWTGNGNLIFWYL